MLLVISATALAIWAASIVVPEVWERWANAAFEQARQDQSASPATPSSTEQATRKTAPDQLVGRLSIPRLHLSALVREGDQESTLSLALGHIPGTALPGQSGNVALAGHRDRIFRGLREIRKDDLIRVETFHGDYVYQVEDTQIVNPEDVGVLRAGGHPELTLVTCYPFYYIGSAPQRFIVKARQVKKEEFDF